MLWPKEKDNRDVVRAQSPALHACHQEATWSPCQGSVTELCVFLLSIQWQKDTLSRGLLPTHAYHSRRWLREVPCFSLLKTFIGKPS